MIKRWRLTRDEREFKRHEKMREETYNDRRGIAAEILSAALLRRSDQRQGETTGQPDAGEGLS